MPTYTRILTPLPDFIILTDEILTQYNASDSIINKISNAINSKLRKDIGYGSLTIKGNYKVFYNKADLGKKKFVYDIYNPLLPIIEIENNED